MPIRYSSIFDGDNNVVGEFPVAEFPNLAKTLQTVVSSVPRREYRRQTVEDTEINYHYLSNGEGRVVGCASTKDVKTRIVFKFLDAVEALARGPAADLRNLKKLLQQKVEYYNDPANDKITAVQDSIDRAKDSLNDNIAKALPNVELIDTLDRTVSKFEDQAQNANKQSTVLNRQMADKVNTTAREVAVDADLIITEKLIDVLPNGERDTLVQFVAMIGVIGCCVVVLVLIVLMIRL